MYLTCREAWEDFYSESATKIYEFEKNQIKISSENTYVKRSIFENLSSESKGGAISCENANLLFLCEEVSFLNCTSTEKGGAMYLTIISESILYKVCGFGCISQNQSRQFDNIEVENDLTKRNEVLDTSITHSIQKGNLSTIVCHKNGKNSFHTANISQNECLDYSSVVCDSQATSSDEYASRLEYCSIANNTARDYISIYLRSNESKKLISFCNILGNEQLGERCGIIQTHGVTLIKKSCILGNKGNKIILIKSGDGSQISSCSIDFPPSKAEGATITDSCTKSFINKIIGYKTHGCDAEFDSFGNLTFAVKTNIKKKTVDIDLIIELILESFLASHD